MSLVTLKQEVFQFYHDNLREKITDIALQEISHQDKAKKVNKLIAELQQALTQKFSVSGTDQEKQQSLLVIQYCASVVSLEYRHMVWPYEYMALSRRVGELWERFCKAAWEHPSLPNVKRISAPEFSDAAKSLRTRLEKSLSSEGDNSSTLNDIETLFELVGEINMKEDEMFLKDETPHIIDFKSGFGSNEKGNTLRLLTVGRAYKLWNPNTQLLLLVRQEQNNNYLNVIKKSGLWEVHCGDSAYSKIDTLTGSNIQVIRDEVIDFQTDLSDELWEELSSHLSDLTSYLQW